MKIEYVNPKYLTTQLRVIEAQTMARNCGLAPDTFIPVVRVEALLKWVDDQLISDIPVYAKERIRNALKETP